MVDEKENKAEVLRKMKAGELRPRKKPTPPRVVRTPRPRKKPTDPFPYDRSEIQGPLDFSKKGTQDYARATGRYFLGNDAVEYIQNQMPEGEQLTDAQKFIIKEEGLVTVPYLDTKGIVTEGVGGVGEFRPKRGENFAQAFLRAFDAKETKARELFDNYDTFSPELQTQIMSGVYRGDFTAGNNTVTAINKGDFRTASEQFLKDSTGQNPSQDYKEAKKTGSGVQYRLEAIQQAFAAEAARRESADRPEVAEPFTSRGSLVSRPKEPTPYERDSFATAEATADQMESLRKEKIAQDLIKDERGLRNNLTSEEQELLRTNQQIAFDEVGVSSLPRLQKGGTPMASEQENDEMIQIGLVQDPNDTDPVSGNEIPLGATAEGVRDDEVAAISPGEFVVPQYAVNYHGLDFYMDSLNTAKQGLRQMDRMGMTGRPDEATLPDDMALPTMEEETTPILDRPIDTEMFMRGGLQTPVHSFANGGLVQYQTGGTYTTPTGLNVPTPAVQTPTVATPTVQTPTVAPGAQVAAAPQQPGQMFYSPMPATPMPMPMSVVPQVQPGTPTISYPDYQGITGGQFGGYKLQEYKHKDTGASIFLTLVGGKLPPGVNVPPGYVTVEEYNQQQEQPISPVDPNQDPRSPQEIENERQRIAEQEYEQETLDREEETKAKLAAQNQRYLDAIAAGENVDIKDAKFVDGKLVYNPQRLLDVASNTLNRSLYTTEHPIGKLGELIGSTITPPLIRSLIPILSGEEEPEGPEKKYRAPWYEHVTREERARIEREHDPDAEAELLRRVPYTGDSVHRLHH